MVTAGTSKAVLAVVSARSAWRMSHGYDMRGRRQGCNGRIGAGDRVGTSCGSLDALLPLSRPLREPGVNTGTCVRLRSDRWDQGGRGVAYCPNDGGTAGGQCMQVRPRLTRPRRWYPTEIGAWDDAKTRGGRQGTPHATGTRMVGMGVGGGPSGQCTQSPHAAEPVGARLQLRTERPP